MSEEEFNDEGLMTPDMRMPLDEWADINGLTPSQFADNIIRVAAAIGMSIIENNPPGEGDPKSLSAIFTLDMDGKEVEISISTPNLDHDGGLEDVCFN